MFHQLWGGAMQLVSPQLKLWGDAPPPVSNRLTPLPGTMPDRPVLLAASHKLMIVQAGRLVRRVSQLVHSRATRNVNSLSYSRQSSIHTQCSRHVLPLLLDQ